MKTISMEYFEYQNDLTTERARMTQLFEPLLKSIQVLENNTKEIDQPNYQGMLEQIFRIANDVKTKFKSGLY